MTDRKDIQEDLSAYLDGELPSSRAEHIEHALADDADLSAELNGLRAVRNLLAALPRERAPRDLAESVLLRAERASLVDAPTIETRRTSYRWMRYTAAAALLMIATALGAMLVSELWPTDIPPSPYAPLAHSKSMDRLEGESARSKLAASSRREDLNRKPLSGDGVLAKGVGDGGTVTIPGGPEGGTTLAHNGTHGKGAGPVGGGGSSSTRHAKGGDFNNGGIVRLGSLPDAEISEVIYTPAIAHTQRRIETFLVSNSIKPIVTMSALKIENAPPAPPRIMGRSNHYQTDRITNEQISIRIEAATLDQIEQIRAEIRRIRGEQRVSQVTIPGETLAALTSPARRGGRASKTGTHPARPAPRPAPKPAGPAIAKDKDERSEFLDGADADSQNGTAVAVGGAPATTRGRGKHAGGTAAEGEHSDKPAAAKPVTDPAAGLAENTGGPRVGAEKGSKTAPAQTGENRVDDPGTDGAGPKRRPTVPPGSAVAKLDPDRDIVDDTTGRGSGRGTGRLAGQTGPAKQPADANTTGKAPVESTERDKAADEAKKKASETLSDDGKGKASGGKHGNGHALASSASQPTGSAGKVTTQSTPASRPADDAIQRIMASRQEWQATTCPDGYDMAQQFAGANVRTLVITLNFRSMVPYPKAIQLDAAIPKQDAAATDQSKD